MQSFEGSQRFRTKEMAATTETTLPRYELPCAPKDNDKHGQKVKEEAEKIIKIYCPPELKVLKVTPSVGTGKYPCKWRVDYRELEEHVDDEIVLGWLTTHRVYSTKMLSHDRDRISLAYCVEYGIFQCRCEKERIEKERSGGRIYEEVKDEVKKEEKE